MIKELSDPRIAVIIHAYHLDVLEELFVYLENIPYKFDLYLNFAEITEQNTKHISKIKNNLKKMNPGQKFYFTTSLNRGQDLGGFFASTSIFCETGLSYDYVCKIHTKSDNSFFIPEFQVSGTEWRQRLLKTLLGSEKRVKEVFDIFKMCPNVGFISNAKFYGVNDFNDSVNKKNYDFFVEKLGLDNNSCWPNEPKFLAGTMFWFRGEVWDFLKNKEITINDFETGIAPDGLRSHAFERVFNAVIKHLGYSVWMFKEQSDTGYRSIPNIDKR